MTSRIGKYKIFKNENNLKIKYVYTISDLYGLLIYLLGLSFGFFFIFLICYEYYNGKKITGSSIFLFAAGSWFIFWFGRIFIILISTFKQSCIEIDRLKKEILLFDYNKKEVFKYENITSIYCKIEETRRPKDKYGLLIFQTRDKKKIEGFIIRSSYALDIGRKVDANIYSIANELKNEIFNFIDEA